MRFRKTTAKKLKRVSLAIWCLKYRIDKRIWGPAKEEVLWGTPRHSVETQKRLCPKAPADLLGRSQHHGRDLLGAHKHFYAKSSIN